MDVNNSTAVKSETFEGASLPRGPQANPLPAPIPVNHGDDGYPKYPLVLFQRVINVILEEMNIVDALPGWSYHTRATKRVPPFTHPPTKLPIPMRSIPPPLAILPGCAIILIACLFPNSSFALPAYIGIALYSIFLTVSLMRKTTPQVKRQILISSVVSVGVALGGGVFFYLR